MLAKATPAFEAVDCLRAVIAKATQLLDQANTKDSKLNAEVTKWDERVKLTIQNIDASRNHNVELGYRQATRIKEQESSRNFEQASVRRHSPDPPARRRS